MADYFVQKRENGNYIPEPVNITHIQETLQLLSVMSGDYRFEQVYNENMEGGVHNMCDVLDRIENNGVQRGIQQGIQQGETAFAKLMQILFSQGRIEDAKRATEDGEYRHALMKEFAISRSTTTQ